HYELRSFHGTVDVRGRGATRVEAYSPGGLIEPETELRDMLRTQGVLSGSFGGGSTPALLLMSSQKGRVVFGLTPTPYERRWPRGHPPQAGSPRAATTRCSTRPRAPRGRRARPRRPPGRRAAPRRKAGRNRRARWPPRRGPPGRRAGRRRARASRPRAEPWI